MKDFISKNEDENNLSNILSIIKISIVLFIGIIIYMNLPNYWVDFNIQNNNQFNLYAMEVFFCITGLYYLIWIIINNKIIKSLQKKGIHWFIENVFYIFIISSPIYSFMAYDSEYKYTFLLLIIYSVIQYGSRYGIITSIFSCFLVLLADLLYAPLINGINIYFQKDLIIGAIFIFLAYILGYYVDMEAENIKKKDKTLSILSNELEEKNKKRESMEAILIKNKICYDILFENSLNAIIVHKEGTIIYANESACKLLGYKNPINLNGKNFYNHYEGSIKSNIKEKYSNISNNKLSKIITEENILNCNGNIIPVRNTSSFFTYQNEPSVLTFLFDITSEKKVETLTQDVEKNLKLLNETREFNNLIMNFFTNISHELKTPVNVIYVAIQTISMYLDECKIENTNKCKSYLKTMKQNCMRMIRLINNLLDITKVDSGFIKLNKKNGNIVSVVEDIVQSVAAYVESRNIEIIFDTNIEEKNMSFDHDMIERIMLNLISNAFKYSNSNGKIYVDLIDKNTNITIKVKDEGEGIPKDKLDVIFERFGQANSSLSRQCEGTGIGLHLVKSFVEMHSGKISVISRENEGSEFIITLPAQLAENKDYVDKGLLETKVEKIAIEFSDIYSI